MGSIIVYIGDTDSDRKQSELAQIPFLFADYGFGKADAYAMKFDSFKAICDYFARNDS